VAGLYISQFSGGIAGINARLCNILRYNSAGPYDYVIANVHGKDGGVGTDGHMMPYPRSLPFRGIPSRGPAAGEEVVDEHHSMPYKTMVPYLYQFANK